MLSRLLPTVPFILWLKVQEFCWKFNSERVKVPLQRAVYTDVFKHILTNMSAPSVLIKFFLPLSLTSIDFGGCQNKNILYRETKQIQLLQAEAEQTNRLTQTIRHYLLCHVSDCSPLHVMSENKIKLWQ